MRLHCADSLLIDGLSVTKTRKNYVLLKRCCYTLKKKKLKLQREGRRPRETFSLKFNIVFSDPESFKRILYCAGAFSIKNR